MKIGQTVNFYDREVGKPQKATIVAITGSGASLAKELTLSVGDETIENVPHGTNAVPGEDFWLIPGVERPPTGWTEFDDEEPILDVEHAAVEPTTVLEQAAEAAAETKKRPRKG